MCIRDSFHNYHPGSEKVATPGATGSHFHEERVGDAHQVRDPVILRVATSDQQESVVYPGKDKEDNQSRHKHHHEGSHVVLEHPQATQAI